MAGIRIWITDEGLRRQVKLAAVRADVSVPVWVEGVCRRAVQGEVAGRLGPSVEGPKAVKSGRPSWMGPSAKGEGTK